MFKTVTDKEKLLLLFSFFFLQMGIVLFFCFLYDFFDNFFHYWLLLCLIDFCRFIKCETFSSLILHISFLYLSFPISGTYFIYIDLLNDVPLVSKAWSFFFHSFFLFASLNNFNGPLFKFPDSFFCQLKSAIQVFYWSFHLSYCTFNFRISVWFLFYNFCLFTDILYLVKHTSSGVMSIVSISSLIYNLFQYLCFFRDSLC